MKDAMRKAALQMMDYLQESVAKLSAASRRPSATATRDAHSASRAALRLPRSLLDKRTEVKCTPRGQAHTAWSTAHRVVKHTEVSTATRPTATTISRRPLSPLRPL